MPSTDQVFELENFRGPLDLLLHLIREQELEITEIDLSVLCDQYLQALALMEAVDINVAGDFLVMAATLILIKSRKLLPHEGEQIDLEEELDPGDELIQQLMEYRRFKTLSMELGRMADDRSLRVSRGMKEVPPDEANELAEIDVWDLVGSYARLMEELGLERRFDTLSAQKPLRAFIGETLSALGRRNRWTLRELVTQGGAEHGSVFGFFLSLLELVKSRQVRVLRDGSDGEIQVELREDRDESRLSFLFDGGDDAEDPPHQDTEPEPQPPTAVLAEEDEDLDDELDPESEDDNPALTAALDLDSGRPFRAPGAPERDGDARPASAEPRSLDESGPA